MVSLNRCFDDIHLLRAGALSEEVSYMGSHVKPGGALCLKAGDGSFDTGATRCAVVHCFYFIVNVVSKYFITMEFT